IKEIQNAVSDFLKDAADIQAAFVSRDESLYSRRGRQEIPTDQLSLYLLPPDLDDYAKIFIRAILDGVAAKKLIEETELRSLPDELSGACAYDRAPEPKLAYRITPTVQIKELRNGLQQLSPIYREIKTRQDALAETISKRVEVPVLSQAGYMKTGEL